MSVETSENIVVLVLCGLFFGGMMVPLAKQWVVNRQKAESTTDDS